MNSMAVLRRNLVRYPACSVACRQLTTALQDELLKKVKSHCDDCQVGDIGSEAAQSYVSSSTTLSRRRLTHR
jgi:hypothetical protein